MSTDLALLTIAVLTPAAMWLSLRVVSRSDTNTLPTRFRRRITWWQLHIRWLYTCCPFVVAAASFMRFIR